METRLVSVVVDALDIVRMSTWWADALGWEVVDRADDEISIGPGGGVEFDLCFVPVTEAKQGKNRVHLDLASESTDHQQRLVARLEAAGARRADIGQGERSWTVLTDPEGNEFCVLAPSPAVHNFHGLACIILDTQDPRRIEPLWQAALGLPGRTGSDGDVTFRDPSGRVPDVELMRVPGPKSHKLRLHLDVAPYADTAHDDAVDRVAGAGATRVNVGQVEAEVGWTVLADAEGNEFCVLSSRGERPAH